MASINYRPEITAQGANNVQSIDIKHSNAEAQAWNSLAEGVKFGFNTYTEYKNKQYNDQAVIDDISIDTKATELRMRMNDELAHMPTEGINAELERQRIIKNAKDDLNGFIKDNARNQDIKEIKQHYHQKSKGFESIVDTDAVKHEIDYGHKKNQSVFNKNDGFVLDQINKANDTNTRQMLRQQMDGSYDLQVQMGYITPDVKQAKLNAIDNNIRKLEISDIKTGVSNAVYSGDYESAEQLVQKLDPYMSKEDKQEFRNNEFGSATYNAFANRINDLNTFNEIEAYKEDVEADKYMSEDKHKSILLNRADNARSNILKSQRYNYKSYLNSAKKGELDVPTFEHALENTTDANGINGDEMIIYTAQSLALASEVLKTDAADYKQASKEIDKGGIKAVHSIHNDITAHLIKGDMSQEVALNFIDKSDQMLDDGDISASVNREIKRKVIDAFGSSIESGANIEDDNWFSWDKEIVMDEKAIPLIKRLNTMLKDFDLETAGIDNISEGESLGGWYEDELNSIHKLIREGASEDTVKSYMDDLKLYIDKQKSKNNLR